jgi:hypothetical protein
MTVMVALTGLDGLLGWASARVRDGHDAAWR